MHIEIYKRFLKIFHSKIYHFYMIIYMIKQNMYIHTHTTYSIFILKRCFMIMNNFISWHNLFFNLFYVEEIFSTIIFISSFFILYVILFFLHFYYFFIVSILLFIFIFYFVIYRNMKLFLLIFILNKL